jgi:hypothetical protein
MAEIYTGEKPKNIYIDQWRKALRSELIDKKYCCANTIALQMKFFDFGHKLGMAVSMNILTQDIEKYKWPSNWMEAVKERFLPDCLLKYFPIKYTTIDVKAIYPKAELPDPIFKAILVKE